MCDNEQEGKVVYHSAKLNGGDLFKEDGFDYTEHLVLYKGDGKPRVIDWDGKYLS